MYRGSLWWPSILILFLIFSSIFFTHSGWKWKHSLSCECVLLMIHMLVSQAFVVKMMLSCNYKYNVTDTKNKSSKISDAPFHMFCGPRLVLKAKRAKLLPFIFVYVLNALFIYLSAYLSYQQTAVYKPIKTARTACKNTVIQIRK